MINRLTLTGADDSTDLLFLRKTSQQYPIVEWGILLSKANFGKSRFPSLEWLFEAYKVLPRNMRLSCHLCGSWVRDLCFEGDTTFATQFPIPMFQRIQLNFHAIVHAVNQQKFIPALLEFAGVQFIFQLDDVNNSLLDVAREAGIDVVPLFDTSGGAGILPASWPSSVGYAGYAGGLSPDNLASQLPQIIRASENKPIWIDAETHLRSENDTIFDEKKCLSFIEKSLPYCTRVFNGK